MGDGGADEISDIRETAGLGLEATLDGRVYRLGRPEWTVKGRTDTAAQAVLSRDGEQIAAFAFSDRLRPGAAEAVAELKRAGLSTTILSGDAPEAVNDVAVRLGIVEFGRAIAAGR